MIKNVISKTLLFGFVVGFVVLFKSIFGEANTLIGVTTITATLMLLENDLTLSLLKNTLKLIFLNLFIGVGSIIHGINPWLGIVANIAVVFFTSYNLCYDLKKPMYFPFLLQYLFLISSPVTIEQIPMRLFSLIFGAVFIVLIQLLANKKRMTSSGNKLLIAICENIKKKIINTDTEEDQNNCIRKSIETFRQFIYDKREDGFYLTEEARIKLSISVALENIEMVLEKHDTLINNNDLMDGLTLILNKLIRKLNNKTDECELDSKMSQVIESYTSKTNAPLEELQLLQTMKLLIENIDELKNLPKNDFNKVIINPNSKDFKSNKLRDILPKTRTLKLSYAIRITTAITLTSFVIDLFNISEGKWLLFTILSIINPLYETSKQKAGDRIVATIIGCALVITLFTIIKDTTIRTIILMAAGYIGSYISEYKFNMICVTVSAVGAAAIIGDVEVLSATRILFVIIGTFIAYITSRLIAPYHIKDSNIELNIMYNNTIKEMLKEITKLIDNKSDKNTIKNLLVLSTLIESRARTNALVLSDNSSEVIIKERRLLTANIYELYLWIEKEKISKEDMKYILNDIQDLIHYEDGSFEIESRLILRQIEETQDLRTRLTLASIHLILCELNEYITDNKKYNLAI